jgi:hypothetical protein
MILESQSTSGIICRRLVLIINKKNFPEDRVDGGKDK